MKSKITFRVTLLLVLISTHCVNLLYAQQGHLRVKVIDENSYPNGTQGAMGLNTSNSALNSIFSSFNVTYYSPYYPSMFDVRTSKYVIIDSIYLFKKYYGIYCDSCDIEAIKLQLGSCSNGCGFENISVIEPLLPRTSPPNDYNLPKIGNHSSYDDGYYFNESDKNWHLEKINALDAWAITTGSSDIKVCVLDEEFATTHIELQDKIYLNYAGGVTDVDKANHGTAVAQLIAGSTNNNEGFASIGYNTKLITYNSSIQHDDFLAMVYRGCR